MNLLEISVVRTLIYFQIFDYPLKAKEIGQFLGIMDFDEMELKNTLALLKSKSFIQQIGPYYQIILNDEMVSKREKGNERAEKMMKKAYSRAALIYSFPFVEAVFLSGSISKNFMDETTDIDYFIITRKNRLWICRTLLILFKKVFLLNSYRFFCLNYFVDTDNLHIRDQNIFTATEIATLIPVYGLKQYHKFINTNAWIKKYYPGFIPKSHTPTGLKKGLGLIKWTEGLIPGRLASWIEKYLLKATWKVWNKRFPHLKGDDINLAMRSEQGVSKHHPNHFQEQVLNKYAELTDWFEMKHGEILSSGTMNIKSADVG